MTPDHAPTTAEPLVHEAPAPWVLTGSGYILLYQFPRSFVDQHTPEFLKGRYKSGIGTVMLVDYQTSPVGSYHELLIVPGLFTVQQRDFFSVSTIYVSSQDSVVHGRANWGLPKNRANFEISQPVPNVECIQVSVDGERFADFTLINEAPLRVPVNTRWIPYRATLIQQEDQQTLLTAPYGRGTLNFVTVNRVWTDDQRFPALDRGRLLGAVRITNFELHFPQAEIMLWT